MSAGNEYRMGDAVAGRYLIEGKLGESPAAKTYLANENHSAQKLVVKVYAPQVSARLLEAPDFFMKAAVQTTLQQDGLAQVFEVSESDGLVVLAREYVEGDSFEAFAQNNDSQGHAYSQGMQMLWQVAQALATMHESHLHLRLHPRNLILGSLGAKLVDADPRALPLSDLVPEGLPMRPEFRGYAPPEARTKGFVAYPNSDLFGLAGLLYRLVTGQNPSEDPRSLHQVLQGQRVAREIENFLVKAMHPKPEDRFGTAEAFSEALWSLQPYLERMQGQTQNAGQVRSPSAPPSAAFLAEEPEPVITPIASSDPFQSFQAPAADPFASSLEAPMREPTLFGSVGPVGSQASNPASDPFASPPGKGSDTLFGAAPSSSHSTPPAPQRVSTDFFSKPEPHKPQTDFGSAPSPQHQPLFAPSKPSPSQPAKPSPRPSPFQPTAQPSRPAYQPPPPPPPPAAAKMSSLESDASDLTLSGSDTGMTQFGFKGASDGDRTGDYRQEVVRRKRKLTLIIGIAASLGVVVLLVVLYFVLRATAPQPKVATTDALTESAPISQPVASSDDPFADPAPTTSTPQPTATQDEPPFPDAPTSSSMPSYEDALSETPAPVTAPKLSQPTQPTQAAQPVQPTQPVQPVASQNTESNPSTASSKVSPERRAAIEAAFKARQFPPSAAERLKMADDFNDLGRLAEANMVYRKALEVAGSTRERTLAYGGMAVTFKNMGMKPDALSAVESLLAINPKNRFALGLKAELQ
jgi:Protein kinase domain